MNLTEPGISIDLQLRAQSEVCPFTMEKQIYVEHEGCNYEHVDSSHVPCSSKQVQVMWIRLSQ